MSHKIQFVHARTRASHASLSYNPYPPKHSGDKPTQELSPVLTLWRSSNFLDPVEEPVGGPPMFTLIHWALSPAFAPNLPGTCPRACWSVTYGDYVCNPPRRFGSGLSLGNRSFPTLPLEELHTNPEIFWHSEGFSSIFKCQHFPISERSQMVATPIRLVNATYPYHTYASQVL